MLELHKYLQAINYFFDMYILVYKYIKYGY